MNEKPFDAKAFLKNVTHQPGVYRMYNEGEEVIYVGKARDLKKRLSHYFHKNLPDTKTRRLVSHIHHIDVTITSSENEALILENSYIKRYRPRYNVVYRDDKSYPYIYLSEHASFPQLKLFRGKNKNKGTYYGPYPNISSARKSLYLLQKLFKLRTCSDTYFSNRQRPCLQYQIKRCSAPCVNYVTPKVYKEQLKNAELFLSGKSFVIIEQLIKEMELAAQERRYENAAKLRDQIALLRDVQAQNYVTANEKSADVITIARSYGIIIVQILFVREGQLIGNRVYYPRVEASIEVEEIFSSFITQHYLSQATPIPSKIILNQVLSQKTWITNALQQISGQKIKLITSPRGEQLQWIHLCQRNADHSLKNHLANNASQHKRIEALESLLGLDKPIQYMECFDISHTQGEATVASCVVFNREGPYKESYRRYNITDVEPGDDYASLYQALTRRYRRILASKTVNLPEVVIIDGGKGQLHQAEKVFAELDIHGVLLMSIAKGPGRKPGLETLFIQHKEEGIQLDSTSPALHLIQYIRDEAHRFAITAHRQKRGKQRTQSSLETIEGVGPKRRRALLQYFGGIQEIKKNSASELAKVPGVSKALAEKIYCALHES